MVSKKTANSEMGMGKEECKSGWKTVMENGQREGK
jgi:hypothetical protein